MVQPMSATTLIVIGLILLFILLLPWMLPGLIISGALIFAGACYALVGILTVWEWIERKWHRTKPGAALQKRNAKRRRAKEIKRLKGKL